MSRPTGCRGLATVEYVGLVAAVCLVIAGLLVVRPHDAGRQAPVRPLPAIVNLIGEPARRLLPPPPRPNPRPPRPRRPRRRPLPERRIVVELPPWVIGR